MKFKETYGPKEWSSKVIETFGRDNVELIETDNAFTVLLRTPETVRNNILVGRYCRTTMVGIILDRRKISR